MEYSSKFQGESFYLSSTRSFGTTMIKHFHDTFEVYYMRSGECSYLIDDKVFDVKSGDVVIIPEGIIHKTNYGTRSHARLLINGTRGYLPDGVRENFDKLGYLYRNENTAKEVEYVFSKLEEECKKEDDEYKQGILMTLTHQLFYIFARNQAKEVVASSEGSFVGECLKYVQENYMQNLSLTDTAKHLSVSPEHLSRTFKRETGFGFNEYVNLVRLKKAEEMLKNESGKSVSEVAYSCGFNDSNYFSVIFKRNYGVTPSEMRRKV